jgi:hypothetical protein
MRPNSYCCVCSAPCRAPRGNWNATRVSLCPSKVCRRKRKSALQKERRKQGILPLGLAADAPKRAPLKTKSGAARPGKAPLTGKRRDSKRKLKFFGGLVD